MHAGGGDDESGDRGKSGRFADLVPDVRPLDRGPRSAEPARPRTPRKRPAEAEGGRSEAPPLQRPRPDQPLLAYAKGVDRATFRRLRSGALRPERSLDLHGLDRKGAHRAVCEGVAAARQAGVRCLRVVHGRGLHSGREEESGGIGTSVLRQALPGWLDREPLRAWVLASAPAGPKDGGSGATLLWLRRGRGPSPDGVD